jgi:hypothetical protein
VKKTVSAEWEVKYSTDVPIWFWGMTDEEQKWLAGWNDGSTAFVKSEAVNWGPNKPFEMRRWRSDGGTDMWADDRWEEGLRV